MHISQIVLPHNGRESHAVLYLPDGAEASPAVLMSHGYNGCKTDFDATARLLAENGVAAMTHTFCGGSTRDESGFPTTQMTLYTEREDCAALLQFLRAHPRVDADKVFLFGGSMGGLVSAMTAQEHPAEIAGMMLLYPALCVADNWRERFPRLEDIPETVDFWGMQLGRVFFTSMREMNVFSMMDYPGPVHILQGDKDPVVRLADSERAVRTYRDARLTVFPGEGHGFTPEGSRKTDEMLLDFVQNISKMA